MPRLSVLGPEGVLRAGQRGLTVALKSGAVAGGGLWEWAGARSQGLKGLEFGPYLEGSGEPWKVRKQGSSWKPEAFSGPGQGSREAEPEAGSLFFRKLALLQDLLESQLHCFPRSTAV